MPHLKRIQERDDDHQDDGKRDDDDYDGDDDDKDDDGDDNYHRSILCVTNAASQEMMTSIKLFAASSALPVVHFECIKEKDVTTRMMTRMMTVMKTIIVASSALPMLLHKMTLIMTLRIRTVMTTIVVACNCRLVPRNV